MSLDNTELCQGELQYNATARPLLLVSETGDPAELPKCSTAPQVPPAAPLPPTSPAIPPPGPAQVQPQRSHTALIAGEMVDLHQGR